MPRGLQSGKHRRASHRTTIVGVEHEAGWVDAVHRAGVAHERSCKAHRLLLVHREAHDAATPDVLNQVEVIEAPSRGAKGRGVHQLQHARHLLAGSELASPGSGCWCVRAPAILHCHHPRSRIHRWKRSLVSSPRLRLSRHRCGRGLLRLVDGSSVGPRGWRGTESRERAPLEPRAAFPPGLARAIASHRGAGDPRRVRGRAPRGVQAIRAAAHRHGGAASWPPRSGRRSWRSSSSDALTRGRCRMRRSYRPSKPARPPARTRPRSRAGASSLAAPSSLPSTRARRTSR